MREIGRERQESILVFWEYPMSVVWTKPEKAFQKQRLHTGTQGMREGVPLSEATAHAKAHK